MNPHPTKDKHLKRLEKMHDDKRALDFIVKIWETEELWCG